MKLRCTGARMTGPVGGTSSAPSTVVRNRIRLTRRTSTRRNRYERGERDVGVPRRGPPGVGSGGWLPPSQPRQDLLHDVLDRPVGGVDDPGPVGHAERATPGGCCRVWSRAGQGSGVLLGPPSGPLTGRRRQVDLEVGVGQHHRADVATLDDAPAVLGHPRRWRSTSTARTSGLAATADTARLTSGPRMASVTSVPSASTRSPTVDG